MVIKSLNYYFIKLLFFLPLLINSNNCLGKQAKFIFEGKADLSVARIIQQREFSNSYLSDASLNNNYPGTKNNHLAYNLSASSYLDSKIIISNNKNFKSGLSISGQLNTIQKPANDSLKLNKTFIFAKNPNIGEFILGNDVEITQQIKVGISNFVSAAGGVTGKYLQYINFPILANSSQLNSDEAALCEGGVNSNSNGNLSAANCIQVRLPRFIIIPQLPIAHGGYAVGFYGQSLSNNYLENKQLKNNYNSFNQNHLLNLPENSFGTLSTAFKFSYISPRTNNWKIGFSFTPNANNILSNSLPEDDSLNPKALKNIVDLGINYVNSFDNLGFAASFILQRANFDNSANNVPRYDLNAYEAGFMLTYLGATFGGSYGWWGKSLQAKDSFNLYSCNYDSNSLFSNQNCKKNNYYTLGAAYEINGASASFTHLASNFANNYYLADSFGIDYKLKKNLKPYIEVTKFKFKSNRAKVSNLQLKDNSGYVILTGFLLSF